jgi:CRP-like cAMP-binding protein
MDITLLFKELRAKQDFSESDLQKLIPYFDEQTFKKNELVFQPGDVVRKTYFIQKGIFRQYYVTPEGDERTIYFVDEGNFAGELMSFLYKTPTRFHFQALEDSATLCLNRENWELAFTTIPALALYQLKLHAQFIFDLKVEMGKAGKETPDEKYWRLVKEAPELFQRLPLFHIANYLGVTPETVSRIRKRNFGNEHIS